MNRQDDRARGQEVRQEMVDRIRVRTLRPLATHRTRTVLAHAYLAAVALACASALVLRGLATVSIQLVAVVAAAGLWVALRRATRLVADAPEWALDELMVRLRNRAFVTAYQLLAAVAVLASCVLFLSGPSGVGEPVATALGWAVFGAAWGLPLVTTAVSLPDADPEP